MKRKKSVKGKISIFYLIFFLITIAFLIAASIYCYLIKYQAIQKYLLSFQVANNELKDIMY